MRSIQSQAMPIVQAMWRHRWLAVGTAWLVCTAGWIGTAFMPTRYESTARVYLNADPLLTPLLRGLAADTDPGRHLDFMQKTLLSRPNLEQLVRLTDLDTQLRTPGETEALFQRLARDISVSPVTANLLALSYRDSNPVMAKNVVQSLLTIFAEKMAGSSRADMDNAQRFLDGEIASYRDQLRAAEKRRADLADKYPDIFRSRSPEAPAGDDNGSRLEQARGTRRLTEAESQQPKIEQIAKSSPEILVQAQDLDRDYSILKRNYMELLARRETTQIIPIPPTPTQKIQFRVVDPPQVPIAPAAPNRLLLVTLVLALGIGAGMVTPLLLMQLDR